MAPDDFRDLVLKGPGGATHKLIFCRGTVGHQEIETADNGNAATCAYALGFVSRILFEDKPINSVPADIVIAKARFGGPTWASDNIAGIDSFLLAEIVDWVQEGKGIFSGTAPRVADR